jgi:cytoskeletal protein CcmA (bactofilin family)
MWTKQQSGSETSGVSPAQSSVSNSNTLGASSSPRPFGAPVYSSSRIGGGLKIKGQIMGGENLQIDGVVDGPIDLRGHELIVGPSAHLNSEVHAGDVVAYGRIVGPVHAEGRVDIKKDGSIIGDISSARISIEDGAHFKGRIEIDPAKAKAAAG